MTTVCGRMLLAMVCADVARWSFGSSGGGMRTRNLDFNPLNLGLNLTAAINLLETTRNNRICDSYIVLKAKDDIFALTENPRGSCSSCCPMKNSDVRMMLFTKDDPIKGRLLRNDDKKNRRRKSLDNDIQTVVFVHGFMELSPGTAGMAVKNAYLRRPEHYNVILVDWSRLVAAPWYLHAVANVKPTARALARFLEAYSDRGEITMSKLHLIGFSLGAHVIGYAGKFLRKDLRIKRITGLDPAYPGFSKGKTGLSKNDADFVDVIHTDGHRCGVPYELGHVDFYANGDARYQFQPGCQMEDLQIRGALHDLFSCSHLRAWKYYAESVTNPEAFRSESCDVRNTRSGNCEDLVYAYMGFAANRNYTGTFYVKTKDKPPYSSE